MPIFEGLTQWGDARITSKHLENMLTLEVRRIGKEEQWKPLFHFLALGGRIVCRIADLPHKDQVVVYDPSTSSFNALAKPSTDKKDG